MGLGRRRPQAGFDELTERCDALADPIVRERPEAQAQVPAGLFAQRFAEGPPLAYRYMKRNLNLAQQLHVRDLIDLEAEAMMRTGRTEDFARATQAFLKKEKPVFNGR